MSNDDKTPLETLAGELQASILHDTVSHLNTVYVKEDIINMLVIFRKRVLNEVLQMLSYPTPSADEMIISLADLHALEDKADKFDRVQRALTDKILNDLESDPKTYFDALQIRKALHD